MKNDIISQLEQLHLSKNEAITYTALVENGQSPAGVIIKKTGLHRNIVYETLEKLIDRTLVFKLEKKNIQHFQALDSNRLVDEAQSQLNTATEIAKKLSSIRSGDLPDITIFEGVEAYRKYWLNKYQSLPVGSEDLVAGTIGPKWHEHITPYYTKKIDAIRKRRKIKWKMIVFNEEDIQQDLARFDRTINEYRLIKRPHSYPGNFNVMADCVLLHSADRPLLIEVKDKLLIQVFTNIFEVLWETGKDIK
ncbi:hypothetical protein GW889_01200 [Candidatus Berkelbacteria bacterium]|uniref:Transcription regulator TrmB N-terminal domain-containing protein n=1 Tax=Candidatus Berkelbacteria bacterium CG10_big_fil_rev_8_21_14_0_10_43_14 TaxID=1974515 RepID=A0A2M6R913_9BACT|nr:hypothetical protein [Candidatus Berkelbacteria bacterium]OIP07164.1 MAG: hypothetical protein AUK41_00400 [Candidatus Berkelbacteria bacterium CG2_30_43_20]PIS07042.1 MAG: hypothetical protein COT79_01445 [Candidatus Berkelbacteria bacterium CG10_big_fil_rev_8_21_14_0_10_43_14]PIU87240.1 MAG: hypothetical protein COS66_01885 [Candidatus Berkelbacteria bacterium CG06_land_8_20_14_3_00_43_10]